MLRCPYFSQAHSKLSHHATLYTVGGGGELRGEVKKCSGNLESTPSPLV